LAVAAIFVFLLLIGAHVGCAKNVVEGAAEHLADYRRQFVVFHALARIGIDVHCTRHPLIWVALNVTRWPLLVRVTASAGIALGGSRSMVITGLPPAISTPSTVMPWSSSSNSTLVA
jgi:hypothetical protein